MRGVLLASLRHHTRRYVAAALAVVIGVAFVVVTGMLTGATRAGLTKDLGAPVAGVDTVVIFDDQRDAIRLVDAAAEKGVPALALGYAMDWPAPYLRSAPSDARPRAASDADGQ